MMFRGVEVIRDLILRESAFVFFFEKILAGTGLWTP